MPVEVDIHSEHSKEFYYKVLKADKWTMDILQRGLVIHFHSILPEYSDKNNKSALDHIDKLKVIISEWEREGKCKKSV